MHTFRSICVFGDDFIRVVYRLLEVEQRKVQQAAIDQERAQERFQTAQAKVCMDSINDMTSSVR